METFIFFVELIKKNKSPHRNDESFFNFVYSAYSQIIASGQNR